MADFIPYAQLTPEQKAMVDNEDYLTRAEAALNGLGLDKLVDDLFPYVRKSVAYYKFGLDKLFFDSEWDVRECAERSLSGLTVEEWIAQNPDKCALPENHLVGNSEREFIPYAELTPEQKALVDSVDNDIRFVAVDEGLGWDKLVDDPSWEVRQCVAFKDYGLDRLVDDPDPRVRFAVAKRDFGLDKLIDDPDEDVRLVVACKINEPDRFADDPDKFVSVFSPFGRKGPTLEEWIAQNPDSCALPENQSNTKLASPHASLDPEAEARNRILSTINAYEVSVGMPQGERIIQVDDTGSFQLKEGMGNDAFVYSRYAEKCERYLEFGFEVDDSIADVLEPYEQIKVCDTPTVFISAGFEQKPMLYTQKHLEDALHPKEDDNPHYHGLTIETIKRLPELLEKPVLMADSPARSDSVVVVLNAVDSDRLPIICAIKPDGRGFYKVDNIETNMILAVYGKDEFKRYFKDRITDERIFYFDKERGHELERLAGIQFPEYYFSRDLDTIIRAPRCFTDQQAPKTTKSSERATSLDELAARARKKANEHNKELNSSKQVAGKKRVI